MLVLGWLFFSVAAGMFAHNRRNRSGFGWFVVAVIFSPLVAFVLLAILQPTTESSPRGLDEFVERYNVWNVTQRKQGHDVMPPRQEVYSKTQDRQAIIGSVAIVATIVGFFLLMMFNA